MRRALARLRVFFVQSKIAEPYAKSRLKVTGIIPHNSAFCNKLHPVDGQAKIHPRSVRRVSRSELFVFTLWPLVRLRAGKKEGFAVSLAPPGRLLSQEHSKKPIAFESNTNFDQ